MTLLFFIQRCACNIIIGRNIAYIYLLHCRHLYCHFHIHIIAGIIAKQTGNACTGISL